MTSPLPPSEGAGPTNGGHDHVHLGRAIVLVVVAVVVGALLLNVASRPTVDNASSTAPPATTTTTHPKTPTTTTTTVPRSSVAVLSANGTSVAGVAADVSTALKAQGWNTLTPVDTTAPVTASAVYYAAGQQASAATIASYLGLKPTTVQPLTTSAPVSTTAGVEVLVVVGPDLAGHLPSTATTTTTTAASPGTALSLTDLPVPLEALARHPATSAVFVDYDGTLSPIVEDPATAVPVAGASEVLARLATRFGLVAVVSGRPAAFLRQVLGPPPGVRLIGLYGMEEVDGRREVVTSAAAGVWREAVAGTAARATASAPAGLGVEPKGLTVTLHWRVNPTTETWARRFAAEEAAATGLVAHPGRRSLELRPPLAIDKGSVVEQLAAPFTGVAFVGDDLGDLPAFDVLDRLAAGGVTVAKVAVVDGESAPEVAARADVTVDGPAGAVALLGRLAG